jgi:protein TonB
MKRINYGLSSIGLMLLLATSCQSIFDDETSITPQEIEEIEEVDHSAFICFFRPELMPSFPGGQIEMLRFIAGNFEWPQSLQNDCVEGTMVVQFTVELDGSLSDLKIVKSIHHGLDPVCLDIVKKMPKWIPGSLRGVPTRTQMNLPIRIHLE